MTTDIEDHKTNKRSNQSDIESVKQNLKVANIEPRTRIFKCIILHEYYSVMKIKAIKMALGFS